MNRWVSWCLNDAGLLPAWHALAANGHTTLCGRPVPVPRIHKHWVVAKVESHYGRTCAACQAKATTETPEHRP